MDKTAIIVITLCALVFGWWMVEENKFAQQQARAVAAQRAAMAALPPAVTVTNPAGSSTTAFSALPAGALPVSAPEQKIVLTNGVARFTFTSHYGGLARVDLLDYPETISQRWKKTKVTSDAVASLNTGAAVPVLAVLGDDTLTGDGQFVLTHTGNTVHAEKKLPGGLTIVKTFEIGTNYLVNTTVRLENLSGHAVALPAQQLVTGTATPMDVDDNAQNEGVMWFDGAKSQDTLVATFTGGGFMGCQRAPLTELWGGSNNVAWVAAHNQFFAVLAMPQEPAARMLAQPVTLPAFTTVELNQNVQPPRGVQPSLVYPAMSLTANSSVERHIVFYTGPKEYRALADIALERKNHADQVMNFGWAGFFAKLLLVAMNQVHDLTTLGYGAVIVLITVIIKVVFWPLTAASTRSMKRMQLLSPELKALQEKYKEDPQKLTTKQWELYKKHKVNPLSGCLPMLVQMPIFIGFFTMIRSAIELRGAHFLWVTDLSKPDTLFLIPGLDFPFNLLPLLMGGAMLWQAHLTPPSPGMDPSQQKIMRYMPLMFLVFLYNYSAGLALYWTTNNLLTILQTKLTKNLKDPAAPPAGPVAPLTNPALTPASKLKK